jgi:hypothetical protein
MFRRRRATGDFFAMAPQSVAVQDANGNTPNQRREISVLSQASGDLRLQ